MWKLTLNKSPVKGKRYRAYFKKNGKIITHTDFGSDTGRTFIDHSDTTKKHNYITRHMGNEDWSDLFSAGALARFLLWGPSTKLEYNVGRYEEMLNQSRAFSGDKTYASLGL